MAEEVKVEEKKTETKEVKKLDDVKNTPENKAALAEIDAKKEKKASTPAVAKPTKTEKKGEAKVELEREYVVPLRSGFLNVPRYKRAKKAVKTLKEFIAKHMGVRDRDLNKIKVNINLNNEIWFRGIKNPMNKIKVKAKKIDGIVYVELAEIPAVVGFKIAREEKRKASVKETKKPKAAEKEEKTEEVKTEEKEDIKAGAEMDAKTEKKMAKDAQHTASGVHKKKDTPVRKLPRNVK